MRQVYNCKDFRIFFFYIEKNFFMQKKNYFCINYIRLCVKKIFYIKKKACFSIEKNNLLIFLEKKKNDTHRNKKK